LEQRKSATFFFVFLKRPRARQRRPQRKATAAQAGTEGRLLIAPALQQIRSSMRPAGRLQRSRFKPDDFARAEAAGEPRKCASFGSDTASWQTYQTDWLLVFSPNAALAPVGDSRRRKQWEAATRQWHAIDAARERDERRYVPVGAAASNGSRTAAVGEAACKLASGARLSLPSASAMPDAVPAMDGLAAGASSWGQQQGPAVPRRSPRLLAHVSVQPSWLQHKASNIQHLEMGTPSLTPSGLHAERELRADVLTPRGHDQVRYNKCPNLYCTHRLLYSVAD
tara:strand:+ start:118 stop:963 length:846 start_codon:yes stop_codon:yes gene_type:complete